MKRVDYYLPPKPQDLSQVRYKFGYSNDELATHACLTPTQWGRYISDANHKRIKYENLFHLAAMLALPDAQLEAIHDLMRQLGATLRTSELHHPDTPLLLALVLATVPAKQRNAYVYSTPFGNFVLNGTELTIDRLPKDRFKLIDVHLHLRAPLLKCLSIHTVLQEQAYLEASMRRITECDHMLSPTNVGRSSYYVIKERLGRLLGKPQVSDSSSELCHTSWFNSELSTGVYMHSYIQSLRGHDRFYCELLVADKVNFYKTVDSSISSPYDYMDKVVQELDRFREAVRTSPVRTQSVQQGLKKLINCFEK